MDLHTAIAQRRMVRAFRPDPVAPAIVDELLAQAARAPSAGFTQGTSFVVLEGPTQTARYWAVTLPAPRRPTFPWPGLLDAPVLVVPCVEPDAYVARYRADDKAATGLGAGAAAWPVPYWFVDGGMAAMTLLLGAVGAGLGACFFGIFEHEDALRREFAIPAAQRLLGTVAIGHPAPDRPSRSVGRGRRAAADLVRRGGW